MSLNQSAYLVTLILICIGCIILFTIYAYCLIRRRCCYASFENTGLDGDETKTKRSASKDPPIYITVPSLTISSVATQPTSETSSNSDAQSQATSIMSGTSPRPKSKSLKISEHRQIDMMGKISGP